MTEPKWELTLSVTDRNNIGLIQPRKNNANSELMRVHVTNKNGEPYDLTALKVFFVTHFSGKDGLNNPVQKEATVINAEEGVFEFTLDEDCMQKVGKQEAYFEIYDYDKFLDTTQNFTYEIISSSRDVKADFSPYWSTLEELESKLGDNAAFNLQKQIDNHELKKSDINYVNEGLRKQKQELENELQNKTENDKFDETVEYLQNQINSMKTGFLGIYGNVNELKTKYPNGKEGYAIVFEKETQTAYSYSWQNGNWIKGEVVPFNEIPDISISQTKLSFPAVEGERSENLFDKNAVIKGVYLNSKGQEIPNSNWATSSFIEWPESANQLTFTETSFICTYDKLGNVTFGKEGIINTLIKPEETVKFRICYKIIDLDKAMVNVGSVLLDYIKFINLINPETIKNKSIDKEKLSFPTAEAIYSDNLFNKNSLTKNAYIDKWGNMTPNANWNISDFIECIPNSFISFSPTSFISFYDSNNNFISGMDTITSPVLVPSRAYKFRICYKHIDLDKAMVNYGDVLLNYVPYLVTLDKEVKVFESSIIKNPNEQKNKLNIVSPKKIYSVVNDLTEKPFYRNYHAELVLDHMLDLNSYDEDILFSNGTQSISFESPVVNDGSDNGFIVNNNQDILTKEKTISIQGDRYETEEIKVKHISVKASTGKDKKTFILTIGDSLTNGHLIDISRPDKVLDTQMAYWAKVKYLSELDRIDGGNKDNDFNWFLMGQKSRRKVKVNYKGVEKEVNAGSEGYGGWSLYSILRHQNRLNPSQETWDYLGLGDGTHLDYKGTTQQNDLIASTNDNFVGKPVNPFFDNDKIGTNKFSISKYLERYRTMDDNGVRLPLDQCGEYVDENTRLNCDIANPTHVILQMGANDLGRTSLIKFLDNIKGFVATIRNELPDAFIGISMAPDYSGTLFPSKFTEFDNCNMDIPGHKLHYKNAEQLNNWISSINEDADKTYLISSYFVQPSAYSTPFVEYASAYNGGKSRYVKTGAGPDIHPNYLAADTWAYQMYSWIKYTLSR